MATTSDEMKIVMQVGTELRITNKGEVVLSNPELELAREESAADAVLLTSLIPARVSTPFDWWIRSPIASIPRCTGPETEVVWTRLHG